MEAVKFAYILFENLYLGKQNKENYIMGDGITFSSIIPSLNCKPWKEWLGLVWEDMVKSNAILKIERPTKTPEVLDGENKLLEDKANAMWDSMKLCGSFAMSQAYFLCGSRMDEDIRIRHYAKYPRWIPSQNKYHIPITEEALDEIVKLYFALSKVYGNLKNEKFCNISAIRRE